jgi:hypothetical protein
MRLAGLFAVALFATPALAAGTSHPATVLQEPTPLPGGLADPAGRNGYVANPHGGIDAIDLKSGELLWTTNEAEKPLFLQGTRLIAQAGSKRNRVRILVFETVQQGECVLESDPIVLPPWVVAGEAVGHTFDAHWRLEHNQVVLSWTASAEYAGPGRPTAQQKTAAQRRGSGIARVDLDSGQVQLGDAAQPAAEQALPGELIEKMSVRWQGVRGNRFYALIAEESGGNQLLVLRSWEQQGSRPIARQELARGKRVLVLPTLDGRYLCLREAPPRPDPKMARKTDHERAWAVFAIETGLPVARVPYEPGTQAISFIGSRAFVAVAEALTGALDRPILQARTLQSVDVKTGKVVWEHAVAGRLLTPPSR